jgi:thiosulfate dehydrogenase
MPAAADNNPGERIATQGSPGGTAACATCHGHNGGGDEGGAFPRLAGLNAGYLARQLRAFRDGGRDNPIMRPMAQPLTDAEVVAVSAYYAALPPASNAKPPTEVSTTIGGVLVAEGDWFNRSLPACAQCHARDGLGAGDAFPALAGQIYSYILGQIDAWATGKRTADPHGLMSPIAARLNLDEARSLAAYYAAMGVAPAPVAGATQGTGVPTDAAPLVRPGVGRAETQATATGPVGPPLDHGPVYPGRPQGSAGIFQPPARNRVPKDRMGEAIRLGEAIFIGTFSHPESARYVGNTQTCEGCHLDAGRLAGAAPMWAAWVAYPAFRTKNQRLNTIAERIQGCFTYSMNAPASTVGHAPEAESDTLVALQSYLYWLATGAPTGDSEMPGRGYPTLDPTPQGFDPDPGAGVYQTVCAVCHGNDGQGTWVRGELLFPPLWGAKSYNWGAGMHRIDTAAAYIRHNMPLGPATRLSDQDAWDVAAFINAQERPQDPRFNGDLAETTRLYHASRYDYYGKRSGPDGRPLGDDPAKR